MPLVRSNSGNSRSYAPVNPPDIRTFNCADAVIGQISSAAKMTTILFAAFAVRDEKMFTVSSSFRIAGGAGSQLLCFRTSDSTLCPGTGSLRHGILNLLPSLSGQKRS
jgi:hypothetical protein